jgi:hypothetical protein
LGSWGDVSNSTIKVFKIILPKEMLGVPNQGWGSDFGESENWGESGQAVPLLGQQQNITVAHPVM